MTCDRKSKRDRVNHFLELPFWWWDGEERANCEYLEHDLHHEMSRHISFSRSWNIPARGPVLLSSICYTHVADAGIRSSRLLLANVTSCLSSNWIDSLDNRRETFSADQSWTLEHQLAVPILSEQMVHWCDAMSSTRLACGDKKVNSWLLSFTVNSACINFDRADHRRLRWEQHTFSFETQMAGVSPQLCRGEEFSDQMDKQTDRYQREIESKDAFMTDRISKSWVLFLFDKKNTKENRLHRRCLIGG